MFSRILHANDGSEHAFHALTVALAIAKQNDSDLHMVSVEEIDYMPEFVEEVREETRTAARRFHAVLQRARAMAEESHVNLKTHVVAGHPVRDVYTCGRSQGGIARYRGERPLGVIRTNGWEPRRSHHAPCPVPGARCEVTRRRSTLPLPPKSHELNPVEYVWQLKCDGWISNRIFESFAEI